MGPEASARTPCKNCRSRTCAHGFAPVDCTAGTVGPSAGFLEAHHIILCKSQKALLQALSVDSKVHSIGLEMHEKVKITLQPFAPFDIPVQWWDELYSVLKRVSPYIKLCWMKSACGAWCASVRLHTVQGRPCIFGCLDSSDELCHYLACPILWYLPELLS